MRVFLIYCNFVSEEDFSYSDGSDNRFQFFGNAKVMG